MKKFVLWLGLTMTALMTVSAQVTVEVTTDQDKFLPGEAIIAAVKITNHSGRILRLGVEPDWLSFSLEARGVDVISKHAEIPVTGEFFLGSSKVATKRVNLTPYFSLGGVGRYSIIATVRVKDLGTEVTSQPKNFDIAEGAKLWQQDVGVSNSTNGTMTVRRYVLQQANYLKNQLQLYLTIVDAGSGKLFGVHPIGPMVSFGQPEPQVDKFNNLHLLFQSAAHSFDYFIFNPDGNVITNQVYDYATTRPRLQPDHDGKVLVKGGALRQPVDDADTSISSTQAVKEVKSPVFPGVATPGDKPKP